MIETAATLRGGSLTAYMMENRAMTDQTKPRRVYYGKPWIDAYHANNLLKLAHYLRTTVVPRNMYFDMTRYFNGNVQVKDVADSSQNLHECDTAACALGHAAFIPEFRALLTHHNVCCIFHCMRVLFGDDVADTEAYTWLFSSDWGTVDNTPEGAADRIDWFVDNGIPENWYK